MNSLYEDVRQAGGALVRSQSVVRARPLYSLQFLRGMAALFVVAYHLSLFSGEHYPRFTLINRLFRHGYAGVDLFFVISGFVIAYTTFPVGRPVASLTYYGRKRLIRVFPVYWLLLLTFWITCRVAYGQLPQLDRSAADWLAAIFLLPNHPPIIPVSWSLSYELYFYALVGLVLYSRRLWVIVALVLAGTLYRVIIGESFTPVWNFLFSPFNLEFLGGFVACLLYRVGPLRASVNGFILFISGLWLLTGPVTTDGNLTGRFLLYGVASIGLIIGLTGLEANRRVRVPDVFLKLGDASYIIYLLHPAVLALFYKFAEKRPSMPFWAFVCISVSLVLVIAVVSIVAHEGVEKSLMKQLNQYFRSAAPPTRSQPVETVDITP